MMFLDEEIVNDIKERRRKIQRNGWPPREQPGSICISFIARLLKRVVAHLQVWLGTICPGTSNVLDECVFNCQGA